MSILIQGMKMPKSCFYCPFREKVNPDDYVCMAMNKEFEETFSLITGKRHKECPLVELPPHGRLIDADGEIGVNITMMPGGKCKVDLIGSTIIPADKEVQDDQR